VKTRILLVICLAAGTLVACITDSVFQTEAAKTLGPSERAVIDQPDNSTFDRFRFVRLQDVDSKSPDKVSYWFGIMNPPRIEVAPGDHNLYYYGGRRYKCHFSLVMLPGHIYKPTFFREGTLEVLDTAPNGDLVTIHIKCLGFIYE
jgi:hypothetical protein